MEELTFWSYSMNTFCQINLQVWAFISAPTPPARRARLEDGCDWNLQSWALCESLPVACMLVRGATSQILHVALTMDWRNIWLNPDMDCICLYNKTGFYLPIHQNNNIWILSMYTQKNEIQCVQIWQAFTAVVFSKDRACQVGPTPSTLTSTPYTLHPTPFTLPPTPYTLHPAPYTLLPKPSTLHPKPSTLNPKPYALNY